MSLPIASLAAEVMRRSDDLACCTEESGRVTRRFLTGPMHAVHARVAEWMREAELTPRVDNAGNIVGRRESASGRRVLLMGSHLDTVPGAGRYDGVLGVLIGVAVAKLLREQSLPFHLDIVGFSEEEGVRFKLPYIGSWAMSGRFDHEWLARKDQAGVTLREAIAHFELDPDAMADCAYDSGDVVGYIEPHIEQGPILEKLSTPVGIVSGISGQSRLRLEFVGRAGHAGTTPMGDRRDALAAASRFVGEVRRAGLTTPGLRATVGSLQVSPNASNVIAGRVELSLDVRHLNNEVRKLAIAELLAAAEQSASHEGCFSRLLEEASQNTVNVDPRLEATLRRTILAKGLREVQLESGAGHDAVVMGQVFPMAMLFVRHPEGVSHHPDERVDVADVAVAIEVLGDFVLQLAKDFV